MATHNPTVSIGLPVFNGQEHLRAALDSLLAQEYGDFELIVCDNASTDSTGEIAAEYAAGDDRVKYHRNSDNIGATANFEKAVELARGEYFMWASCHDLWTPRFLQQCIEPLVEDQEVVLCYPRCMEIDASGKHLGRLRGEVDTRRLGVWRRYRRVSERITGYAVYGVFRQSALKEVLPMRPILGPDAFLLAELSFLGTYAVVPEELFFLRRMSVSRNWRRYFGNLKLAFGWWRIVAIYPLTLRAYLSMVRRRTRGIPERFVLGIWTIVVHLARTAMWFLALLVSLVFPRYYRPW